jgi:hypothetical protein
LSLILSAALVLPGAALRAPAQSRSSRTPARRAAAPEPTPTPTPAPTAEPTPAPQKATARPEGQGGGKTNSRGETQDAGPKGAAAKADPNAPVYIYEFEHPDFVVYLIHIEHDDAGRGHIRFERRSDVEQLTEPFELSPAALARVRARWAALKFLDSTAQYQGERNYPSYGKSRLTMRQGGRERTAEFNYAADPDAFALADEYRRAADQAVFVFEVKVALESQPLETPKLISRLEILFDRKALSDPAQLLPLVRELTQDERVPLVGRNHAARILKKMEKHEKQEKP